MPGFTDPNNSFIRNFYYLVRDGGTSNAEISAWLFNNAKGMDKSILSDPLIRELDPVHILALRALTPENVFVEEAKQSYLDTVNGNQPLVNLAKIIFFDDYSLARQYDGSQMVDLIFLQIKAYLAKIRPVDRALIKGLPQLLIAASS